MQREEIKKTKWAPSYFARIVVIILAITIFAISLHKSTSSISINAKTIYTDIANTSQKRQDGLCCRDYLAADQGMLFTYSKMGDYRFWMKDTRIPLDIIWINSDREIVHIEHNVKPESYPKTFSSPVLAQYILETNAGVAKRYAWQKSDKVTFNLSAIDSLKLLLP